MVATRQGYRAFRPRATCPRLSSGRHPLTLSVVKDRTPLLQAAAGLGLIVAAALASYVAAKAGYPKAAAAAGQAGPSLTDWMQGLSAVATTAFTGVLLVVSWRQWGVGKESADAALTGARVAREAFVSAHRPTFILELLEHGIGAMTGSQFLLSAQVELRNLGSTAIWVQLSPYEIWSLAPDAELPEPRYLAEGLEDMTLQNIVVLPGETHIVPVSRTFDAQAKEPLTVNARLFVVASVLYRDAVGISRERLAVFSRGIGGGWYQIHGRFARERVASWGPLGPPV